MNDKKQKLTKFSLHFFAYLFFIIPLTLIGCKGPSHPVQHKSASSVNAGEAYNSLVKNFLNPPKETKPLTWYHSMNSNMSAAGITKDFESMAKAGIGGVLYFSVGLGMPKGDTLFNSEKHINLIGHMGSEAKRLGMTFGIHNSDGWSSSGGPWNTPEHSMKQVTWNQIIFKSNTDNNGHIDLKLEQPMTMLDYYKDIAVIAYPSLPSDIIDNELKPIITASDPNFDITVVNNIEVDVVSPIKSKNGQPVWLQFAYEKPVTIRFASVDINWGKHIKYEFQYSNDGSNFKKHVDMKVNRPGRVRWALDASFEGVTAKYFRIVANKTLNVFEASLSSTPRLGNYLGRTLATHTSYHKLPEIGTPEQVNVINSNRIINLTDKLSSDGRINAILPAGNWTIMRFGYTSKGTTNIPPTSEGRGLEVDKFSRVAFKNHYDAYVKNVINELDQVAPNAMQYVEIDSYEVGGQNWTQGYESLFMEEHGYDLIPFLPLFTGKFVDSTDISESVTWDIRNLSNKLITENYYQYFTELAHKDGLKTYTEPYGHGPFNELDAGSKVDITMGEFWLRRNIYMLASAISVGHIYDKNIISAESFTALPEINWKFNPAYAKFDGDKSWALGINQFVFHRFVHQANTHVVPGMTMERWGAHIDGTQPWFASAGKAWFNYIARGQYLLRQGQPVSDVLWYLGEAVPTGCPERRNIETKLVPTYVNYDCINNEKFKEVIYQDGRYQLKHGLKYKILALKNHETLSIESVTKIFNLAQEGGVIIGEPIKNLAGLNVSADDQDEFKRMVDFIWSQPNTYRKITSMKDWDKIYKQNNFNYDLRIKNVKELFYAHRKTETQDIYFIYNDSDKRRLFEASFDITDKIPELWNASTGGIKRIASYKSANGVTQFNFRLEPQESTFVVFDKPAANTPRLKPDVIANQDVEALYDEQFNIKLESNSNQEFYVELAGNTSKVVFDDVNEDQELSSSWMVSFEKAYGLGQRFIFDELINWKDSTNPEIRAYSGIATYSKTFNVSSDVLDKSQEVTLDLGIVADTAQVFLNNKEVGSTWIKPHCLVITSFLQPGENILTVKLANSWTNRMIHDETLPDNSGFWGESGKRVTKMPSWYINNEPLPNSGLEGHRRTFTTHKFIDENEPLINSGLIGPVKLTFKQSIHL